MKIYELKDIKGSAFSKQSTNNIAEIFIQLYIWVGQKEKNLPLMQETQVQSLGQEGTLEKGIVIHSNSLAWRIPCTEEPGRLQSTGWQRVGHNWSDLAQACYQFVYYNDWLWDWNKRWFQCEAIFRSEGKFVSKVLNSLWWKRWI